MNKNLYNREYNYVFSIGPSCITSYLVRSIPSICKTYDQNFITHFKDYKNIESSIYFVNHMLDMKPEFYYQIGFNIAGELNNTTDTVFYHFVTNNDLIDIRWHFGLYKKFHENGIINTDKMISELTRINDYVKRQFVNEQKSLVNFTSRLKNDDHILFLRLENKQILSQYDNDLSEKYKDLQTGLKKIFKHVDLLVFLPDSSFGKINKKIFDNIIFIPDEIFDQLHIWDNYKKNILPQYCRNYMCNIFDNFNFKFNDKYKYIEYK